MRIEPRHPHRDGGRPLVLAAAIAGLLLAGCAGAPADERGSAGGGGPSTVSAVPPPTSAPATTLPGPGGSPTSTAPKGSPPTTGSDHSVLVVRGTVRKGVEPGCLLLDGQDKHAYLLIGDLDRQLADGAKVEVVGQQVDQIASFCGEGTALAVVSVRPVR